MATRTIGRYLWNLAIAEAAYPTLHLVEIALRNRLDAAIAHQAGAPNWFELPNVVHEDDREDVANAQARLVRASKDPHDPGRVVAELMFGFWVALLARRYADPATAAPRRLWPALLERAFPNIQAGLARGQTRGIMELRRRFHLIVLFRNRVSHHEPVWRGLTLDGQHHSITELQSLTLDALDWLSPESAALLVPPVTRLVEVVNGGETPFVQHVASLFPLPAEVPLPPEGVAAAEPADVPAVDAPLPPGDAIAAEPADVPAVEGPLPPGDAVAAEPADVPAVEAPLPPDETAPDTPD